MHDFDTTVALHETEETGHPEGPEYNTYKIGNSYMGIR